MRGRGRDERGGGNAWQRGHAWQGGMSATHAPPRQTLRDTVNEWAVSILLECILVWFVTVSPRGNGWCV